MIQQWFVTYIGPDLGGFAMVYCGGALVIISIFVGAWIGSKILP